ncbi:hypothetical protein M0804_015170 [Polistes exclamans]|nr:hypothetical protein M0804_015170 [Polistes exclamans]
MVYAKLSTPQSHCCTAEEFVAEKQPLIEGHILRNRKCSRSFPQEFLSEDSQVFGGLINGPEKCKTPVFNNTNRTNHQRVLTSNLGRMKRGGVLVGKLRK